MNTKEKMNWKINTIDVGEVPEMQKVNCTFEGTDDMKTIHQIKAGCVNCTSYKFYDNTNTLDVIISLGQTPVHLRGNKTNKFEKRLTIIYKDGTNENIFVIGKKVTK